MVSSFKIFAILIAAVFISITDTRAESMYLSYCKWGRSLLAQELMNPLKSRVIHDKAFPKLSKKTLIFSKPNIKVTFEDKTNSITSAVNQLRSALGEYSAWNGAGGHMKRRLVLAHKNGITFEAVGTANELLGFSTKMASKQVPVSKGDIVSITSDVFLTRDCPSGNCAETVNRQVCALVINRPDYDRIFFDGNEFSSLNAERELPPELHDGAKYDIVRNQINVSDAIQYSRSELRRVPRTCAFGGRVFTIMNKHSSRTIRMVVETRWRVDRENRVSTKGYSVRANSERKIACDIPGPTPQKFARRIISAEYR